MAAQAMPLDSYTQRFLERLAATNRSSAPAQTLSDRRAALQQLLAFACHAEEVRGVEERTIPGAVGPLRARLYTPLEPSEQILPGLIYFHGGGLVAGSLESHDPICRAIANASGCRLISIDYRLAPEAPFPAAVEDGRAATRWIAEHAQEIHLDPRRLGLCGDSAGATLAAVVSQSLGDSEEVGLAFQFLLCPIVDFGAETSSRRNFGQGYFLEEATLASDLSYYLGPSGNPLDPRISPLRATDFSRLPPSCIHTAEFDPLRDEGEAYAHRLRSVGMKVICRRHPGMIHMFYGMGTLIPYAKRAYELMGTDIRSMLAETTSAGDSP